MRGKLYLLLAISTLLAIVATTGTVNAHGAYADHWEAGPIAQLAFVLGFFGLFIGSCACIGYVIGKVTKL